MKNNKPASVTKVGGAIVLSVLFGLASLMPLSVFAGTERAAFKSTCVNDAIAKVTGQAKIVDSKKIVIDAPAIAENGTEVKVSVNTQGLKNVEHVSIYAEKNPTPLVASYAMPKGVTMQVGSRIKMLESQRVIAIVKADGKYYRATKTVKITIGGCGGGGSAPPTASKTHCK